MEREVDEKKKLNKRVKEVFYFAQHRVQHKRRRRRVYRKERKKDSEEKIYKITGSLNGEGYMKN